MCQHGYGFPVADRRTNTTHPCFRNLPPLHPSTLNPHRGSTDTHDFSEPDPTESQPPTRRHFPPGTTHRLIGTVNRHIGRPTPNLYPQLHYAAPRPQIQTTPNPHRSLIPPPERGPTPHCRTHLPLCPRTFPMPNPTTADTPTCRNHCTQHTIIIPPSHHLHTISTPPVSLDNTHPPISDHILNPATAYMQPTKGCASHPHPCNI